MLLKAKFLRSMFSKTISKDQDYNFSFDLKVNHDQLVALKDKDLQQAMKTILLEF